MSNDTFTIAVLIAKFAAKFNAHDKRAASASDKIASIEKSLDVVSKMPGPIGPVGKDGRNGVDGRAGERGATGANGVNGKDGAPGADGKAGANGINGKNGAPGADGKAGAVGPMPKHEWRGTELRFQQSEKRWGKWVNLRGPAVLSSVGSSNSTAFDPSTLPPAAALPLPSEVLVLQDGQWTRATWGQFIGWAGGVAPAVTSTLLTEDGNNIAAEDGMLLQQE